MLNLSTYSSREIGDYFEEVCIVFLKNDKGFKNNIKGVTKFSNWAKSNGLSAQDTGIDLVVEDITGEFWAVQCKNFNKRKVDKSDLDSFISTSAKIDPKTGLNIFSRRLIFTSSEWTTHATTLIENLEPAVTRIDISRLDESNINWESYFSESKNKKISNSSKKNA